MMPHQLMRFFYLDGIKRQNLIDYISYNAYKGGENMDYKAILKQLAKKENVPVSEIEKEMKYALSCAGINCSAEEFIKMISFFLRKKDYI